MRALEGFLAKFAFVFVFRMFLSLTKDMSILANGKKLGARDNFVRDSLHSLKALVCHDTKNIFL